MKRIIITTTAVLAASLTFYMHEGISLSKSPKVFVHRISYETFFNSGFADMQKLDIDQIDLK